MSEPTVLKEGWATKQGGFWKTWHRRWFVLVGKTLEYMKQPGVQAQGEINLDDVDEISVATQCKKGPSLQLVTPERTYFMVFDKDSEVKEWIDVLKKAKESVCTTNVKKNHFDDYQVIRFLYQGIHSTILLVKNIHTGETYVAKRYSKQNLGSDYSEIINKYRALLIGQQLPYIAELHEIIESRTAVMFLMKNVPYSLASALNHAPIKYEFASTVFTEIMVGLNNIHSVGFYYGDFHLENVLLDSRGHVILSLPGFTLPLSDTQERFIQYMDPHVLETGKLEQDSDFYGAGIIFFEMLAGYTPFIQQNRKLLIEEMKRPIVYPPQITVAHRRTLENLISPDVEKRKKIEVSTPSPSLDLSDIVKKLRRQSEAMKAFENDDFENDCSVLTFNDESAIMQAI